MKRGYEIAKEEQKLLRLTTEGPSNVDSKAETSFTRLGAQDFCGAFAALGLDNSWDAKAFKRDFQIEMKMLTEEQVVSDAQKDPKRV